MARRVSFSNTNMSLNDISLHYADCEASLRAYFGSAHRHEERFGGFSEAEVFSQLRERRNELSHSSSFTILAALEAVFRIDYLQRAYRRKKDVLSRDFRQLYKEKGTLASLENDILAVWKIHTHHDASASKIIGELKGALKYRHWLAHGRYWEQKSGIERYDYLTIYGLAEQIMDNFPLEGLDS